MQQLQVMVKFILLLSEYITDFNFCKKKLLYFGKKLTRITLYPYYSTLHKVIDIPYIFLQKTIY